MTSTLIIDTDPALGVWHGGRPRDVDDAFAIVEALHCPDVDVAAVTVTYGNAPLGEAVGVTRTLTELLHSRVPVFAGAAVALPESGIPSTTDAVRFLADHLRAGRARILALGPLSNIGALLLLHPELATQIDEVVIVAGRTAGNRFYIGDAGPVRDFNFENDVRAAAVLLAAGVPVTMAGFELSSRVVITADHLARLATATSTVARHLHRGAVDWFAYWTRTFPADAGFHPWDSAALWWLLHPQAFTHEWRGARIRHEVVTPAERARNPDGSAETVPWLETGADLAGQRVRYITGFAPDGQAHCFEAMLAAVMQP